MAENGTTILVDAMGSASAGKTRPAARKGASSKISDYFERRAATLVREDSALSACSSVTSPSLSLGDRRAFNSVANVHACESDKGAPSSDNEAIGHKITSGNGWQVARRLQIPKKRVKREISFDDDDDDETDRACQRHGARAKLGLLPSLPLDTLFEIFCHLMPLDLLHLSRTTKDFRRLLLHRSATGLWKDVLSNVEDVPSCPPDMSLPSWVNLLFETNCHKCLARNASKCNDFLLRVRYCGKCVKTELSSEDEYDKEKKQDAIILRAVPFSACEYGNSKKYCVKSVRDAFLRELDSYPGDRTAFVEDRRNGIKARTQHATICKKWFKQTIRDRIDELDIIRKSRQDAIREKLSILGYQKELDFLDRLDRSWRGGCAVIPRPHYTLFKDHDLVKQCKLLTDRTWANMKGTMVTYMEEMHDLRLRHERCIVVRQRRIFICQAYRTWRRELENLEEYPMDSIMPGVADILEWSIARGITEKPGDESVNDGEIARLKYNLPNFINLFRQRLRLDLRWMTDCVPLLGGDFFLLAVVVFRCKNESVHWVYERNWLLEEGILSQNQLTYEVASEIREPCMWYPEFIFHPCCTIIRRPWEEEVAQENLFLGVHNEFTGCRRDAWDVRERLEFDEKASKTVINLLDTCGLSHKTRVDELDKLDYRFVCLKCSFGNKCDGERRVRVWSWRDAVHHNLKTHFGNAQVKWECISPEDTATARELEEAEFVKRGYRNPEQQKRWKCIACQNSSMEGGRMTWSGLQRHFRRRPDHGDEDEMEDKEGILYYKALGYTIRERPPVKMKPGKVIKE